MEGTHGMDRIKMTIAELHHGKKIREFLKDQMKLSSRLIKRSAMEGRIHVNGNRVRLDYILREGDEIDVLLEAEEVQHIEPEDIPIEVIYEDASMLVISKDPGMVVHPTKSYQSGTLANAAIHHFRAKGEPTIVRLVSRLDMDTSGLIILAKNQFIHSRMSSLMQEDRVDKWYLAVVAGDFPDDVERIDLPIFRDPDGPYQRIIDDRGQRSITEVSVLERANGYSLLRLKLLTGRTHQIRVHLSHLGFPILGDSLYGSGSDLIGRQALHAHELMFNHPMTGDCLDLKAPLKQDMSDLLKKLGFHREA